MSEVRFRVPMPNGAIVAPCGLLAAALPLAPFPCKLSAGLPSEGVSSMAWEEIGGGCSEFEAEMKKWALAEERVSRRSEAGRLALEDVEAQQYSTATDNTA